MGKKKQVICDTMIWYGIAEGRISIDDHKDVDLVSTGVTIIELASTENLTKNIEKVKGALKAMTDHSSVRNMNAFDFILKYNVDIPFEPDLSFFDSRLLEFDAIIDNDISGFFDDPERVKSYDELILEINKPAQQFADDLNSNMPEQRKKNRSAYGGKKQFHKQLKNDENSYKTFTTLIAEVICNTHTLQVDDIKGKIQWDHMELFFLIWDIWWKDEIMQPSNSKIELNDIYDHMNMAFVGADELYWTEEHSWLQYMDSKDETRKYIYNTDHPKLMANA